MTEHFEREVYASLIGVTLRIESELSTADQLSAFAVVNMAITATGAGLPMAEVLAAFEGTVIALRALRCGDKLTAKQREFLHHSAVSWERAPHVVRSRAGRIREAYTRTRTTREH